MLWKLAPTVDTQHLRQYRALTTPFSGLTAVKWLARVFLTFLTGVGHVGYYSPGRGCRVFRASVPYTDGRERSASCLKGACLLDETRLRLDLRRETRTRDENNSGSRSGLSV